jgi:hypothetical protein
MQNNKVIRSIVEDPEQPGELLLDLGNELCDELGWREGDVIEWIDNKDGSWTLKKSTNS